MGSEKDGPGGEGPEIRNFDVLSEWCREEGWPEQDLDRLSQILVEVAEFMATDRKERAADTAAKASVIPFPDRRGRRRDS